VSVAGHPIRQFVTGGKDEVPAMDATAVVCRRGHGGLLGLEADNFDWSEDLEVARGSRFQERQRGLAGIDHQAAIC
jgi:hypothetical protein